MAIKIYGEIGKEKEKERKGREKKNKKKKRGKEIKPNTDREGDRKKFRD